MRARVRHVLPGRLRYGRVTVSAASLATLVVAVLGGTGLLGEPGGPSPASADGAGAGERTDQRRPAPDGDSEPEDGAVRVGPALPDRAERLLPRGSGEGRRVVYSQSQQRAWLVPGDDDENQANDTVQRTYPVSGSRYDNLDPGTYEVYSRSEQAWGIDDSGTMRHFVRFTQGDTGAAIGFHDIPVDDGEPVQSHAELGTPQSHGCIRQRPADAVALWEFAPVGTTVVVTP